MLQILQNYKIYTKIEITFITIGEILNSKIGITL